MGGICAALGLDAEQHVKKMCGSLRHRGPDDEGFFISKNLALGHRALKTTNIPVPHQPLSNEDGTIWITFDGEIYNKSQLIEQLEKNHTFHTSSSAEVAVHTYEEDGPNCVKKFNGMFAFCLWDSAKGKLFCARDRLGMKPLYYNNCQGQLILASEIKALLTDPSVPRKPNEHVIYDFLVTGHQHHTGDTFFKGIKELPPAHYMFADQKQISLERYWDPAAIEPNQLRTDEYYVFKFRELLLDSIKIRLPMDLPVGSFLSGGLDSTSIVCLVNDILKSSPLPANVNREPQKLFSAVYRESVADERSFIGDVSRFVTTKIHCVFPSAAGLWNDIKTFIYYMDEPVSVLNYYVYWCLARITRGQVKVAFSGQGPDEFLAGHSDHFVTYLKELWKRKKIPRLLIELVASLNRYGFASIIRHATMMFTSSGARVKKLLEPQFVVTNNSGRAQREDNSLRSALLLDVTQNRLPIHLRVGDRVSSAFSIECRCPYLDHRIIEFAFSLPETQKIRNGWTKYVLRNAMKGFIPEAVRRKKKFGTPIPLERWMQDLHGKIREVFNSSKFRERGYFNQASILDVFDRYCEGKLSHLERQYYADVLWRILNLELWLEAFFDSDAENKLIGFWNKSMEERSRWQET
jgi:asparagine synthase (glutamine-hydrolysing)